ncbi:hypothetical protein F5Y16DRAFT_368321 [Xylariaceae sp. FL0255]|nr:hypothetical protein F5Y16DRAFT_368321 [Xylariaceae sp. FL0255]
MAFLHAAILLKKMLVLIPIISMSSLTVLSSCLKAVFRVNPNGNLSPRGRYRLQVASRHLYSASVFVRELPRQLIENKYCCIGRGQATGVN